MVTMSANSPVIPRQGAELLCQAIATIHQYHPEWFIEKIRHHDWQKPQVQDALVNKLAGLLDQESAQEQTQRIRQLLQQFFLPAFFESSAFQELQAQLNLLESASTEPLAIPNHQPYLNGKLVESNRAIALLLLDAENLKLDIPQENFLRNICTLPLQIKIAFANWKACGKYDEELHQRGYDLMHVPSGNDMADGKMIVMGSSIHDHYPTVQEVLVCSSDKVMTNLHTKLSQQGLTVYQVRKQQDGAIAIVNSNTGQTFTCPKVVVPTIPPLETCITHLKEILRAEQQKTGILWIELAKISQLFRDKYKFSISQLVTIHQPGKRARELFIDRPEEFVVHQASEQAALYIALFEAAIATPLGETALPNSTELQKKAGLTAPPSLNNGKSVQPNPPSAEFPLKTANDLETAIAKIIKSSTQKDPDGFVNISAIGSQFRQQYQQPITAVLKQLEINKRYPTFLQACPKLVVQQKGNLWRARLR
ncbi:NYN domain-containing protein [Leptolyngbyaceae cyanobacterium UHCC 1019]